MTAPSTRPAIDALVSRFVTAHPGEAADALEHLPPGVVARHLGGHPSAHIATVLDRLTPATAAQVLLALPPRRAARVLGAFDPGRAVALLAWVEDGHRESLLATVDPRVARELRALAEYPPESAGRLMDPRVVAVHPDATVREVLARVRTKRRRIDDIFVVDGERCLIGVVPLQQVAVSAPSERMDALVQQDAPRVLAMARREDVAEQLAGRRVTTLAVVDLDGRLLGMLRADTLLSVAQEDAGADMVSMVGASRQERPLSPVSFTVRKRLPWLHINLLTAFTAASVVGLFESTIARFTALAVLMPVVANQSGNTGSQAMAVTMRGLVLRDVRVRHWLRVVWKEGRAALVNGCALALTTSAAVLLWSGSAGLALIIALAMVTSMLTAAVAGAMIPMVLTALNQDPAQSSSIILTAITDIVGFLSFLGIATLLAWMI
jgi:magnesium transporter